ncbi:hypothetical protein C0991_011238 [Blastosporella zonata]|nr:hypothetical protein C0991_011238 [Blastosporella zonata]
MVISSSQPSSRAFGRIRSSLEQSLRAATRSKKAQSSPVDELGTVVARQTKDKDKGIDLAVPQKEKEKGGMLRRLESKVTFRRAGRETPSPLPPMPVEKDPVDKMRLAGFASFITPSMRQGSMSSPSLHLSSQAVPSPKSRPSIPISSSSNSDIHATPTRDRTQRRNSQPPRREIGSPTTLGPHREAVGQTTTGANQTSVSRHRSTKSVPLAGLSTSPTPRRGVRNDDSGISFSGPPNPEFRDLIRTSSSMLCKEIIKVPPHMSRSESGVKDWEEVEVRTRALARAERIWGKTGGTSAESTSNLVSSGGGLAISATAEDRERRLFSDALRDGFMNKLRSASIVKPDARDDGVVRMSNITKFLAACSSYGLPEEDIFLHDDLIEATGESLARVARTIIALVKFVDAPVVEKSRIIHGQRKKLPPISIPSYQQEGTLSRASASTPNLLHRSTSSSPTSPVKKRHSPSDISNDKTVRGASPAEIRNSQAVKATAEKQSHHPPVSPPPRSPLRAKSNKTQRNEETELTAWAKAAASPPRTSRTDSTRPSTGDASIAEPYDPRQSIASSAMTETTATTDISSILDFARSSSSNNKYGTIRTITTDLTSEAPSMTRTEGSAIAEELTRKKSGDSATKYHRDRKSSEVPLVDLSRVIEEGDESASTSSRGNRKLKAAEHLKAIAKPEKAPALHLHKGKWPDDFMNAFQAHSPVRAITPKSPAPDQEGSPKRTPISISPPRKLAVVSAAQRIESVDTLPQFPRRPTHRARQSVDAPILMPKETIFGRDSSPDGIAPGSSKVMLRRHSTKPGAPGLQKNGVHFLPQNRESRGSNSPVPFPRTTSIEHSGSPSPVNSPSNVEEKPHIPRGRFQSDINDSSSRRRARPDSHDELGVKPMRSRIESMVNLGADSANASASDLLLRDSVDGSMVRKTLILREEGKPATHFVSSHGSKSHSTNEGYSHQQLGNCIGRGQFGSVYRALNLNTGQMVAVKRIRLEGLKESEITTLMREVDLVKSLSHPSIVKYEGMARDADTLSIVLE